MHYPTCNTESQISSDFSQWVKPIVFMFMVLRNRKYLDILKFEKQGLIVFGGNKQSMVKTEKYEYIECPSNIIKL